MNVNPYHVERVNRNLLDNWYFGNPVNQKGETNYTDGNNAVTIDRWRSTGIVNVEDGYIQITASQGTCNFSQNVDMENYNTLKGKTVTFSVLLSGNVNILYYEGSYRGLARGYFNSIGVLASTITVGENSNRITVYIQSLDDTPVKVYAAKLEIGDKQTLAHQEGSEWALNEVPDYKEELAKCRRYFQVLQCPLGMGAFDCTAYHANSLLFLIPTTTLMRVAPTISGDTLRVYIDEGAGGYKDGFTFTCEKIGSELYIRASEVGHGVTADKHAVLIWTTNPVYLDANL